MVPDPLTAWQYGTTEWTLWDRFVFENNPTLETVVKFFKEKHGLEISMVSQGVSMLWSSWTAPAKVCSNVASSWTVADSSSQSKERLKTPFKQLVETVSKVPLPPTTKQLIVEIMAADETDEDVEVWS